MQASQIVQNPKLNVKLELLQVARQYISKGFSVVPVDANKASTIKWAEYQERLMTDDELPQHFTANTYGIALICGQVSADRHTYLMAKLNDEGLSNHHSTTGTGGEIS